MSDAVPICKKCVQLTGSVGAPPFYKGGNYRQVLLIGESPHKNWAESGSPFYLSSGKLNPSSKRIFEYLMLLGYKPEEVALIESAKCIVQNRRDLQLMMANCRPELKLQIEQFKPKLIITFGKLVSENLGAVLEMKLEPCNIYEKNGTKIMPLFHPSPINPNNHKRNLEFISSNKYL